MPSYYPRNVIAPKVIAEAYDKEDYMVAHFYDTEVLNAFQKKYTKVTNISVIEDKLGFDQIYIQAKNGNQSRVSVEPEIYKFAGALLGQGATKGLYALRNSVIKRKNLLQNNY